MAQSPLLSVQPTRALVDEKFKVLVESLSPGCPVTVHSHHHSEDKDDWEAYGHYISDQGGTVSVSEDVSLGGTYSGKEPMGLLWSMRPVPGSRTGLRLRKRNVCSPMLVNISVYSGHEGFKDRAPLASVLTERWFVAPGIQRIDIRENGVRGTLFIPPGPGPFPWIMDLWGGGGGLLEYRSALLASHGYVSLALEYVRDTELEFDYFEKAFHIANNHPQVIPGRVGLFGLSLGSLVSLSLAAESAVVKPCCVVCISVNHVNGGQRKISDSNHLLREYVEKIRVDEDNNCIWRDISLEAIADPSNKVDVAKINAPLFLISGCDDQNWSSVDTVDDIARLMHPAGKEHLLSRVDYPDAGHLIEPPYTPHFRATNFILTTKEKVVLLWGGQTKPHSDAQEDSWRKILSFLKAHLYDSPSLKAKL